MRRNPAKGRMERKDDRMICPLKECGWARQEPKNRDRPGDRICLFYLGEWCPNQKLRELAGLRRRLQKMTGSDGDEAGGIKIRKR